MSNRELTPREAELFELLMVRSGQIEALKKAHKQHCRDMQDSIDREVGYTQVARNRLAKFCQEIGVNHQQDSAITERLRLLLNSERAAKILKKHPPKEVVDVLKDCHTTLQMLTQGPDQVSEYVEKLVRQVGDIVEKAEEAHAKT